MTLDVDRDDYLRWVGERWPDKERVVELLADSADTLSRNWPPASRQAVFKFLVTLGLEIERAENKEACVDAFFGVLRYLECPEPGWL